MSRDVVMAPLDSEDLAPLLAAAGPPPGNVTFRQGVVRTWNTLTAENTVEVGGTVLTDLPTIASSAEVLTMQPGDVVGIQAVNSGGWSTMYIIGRITRPGTPQAASFMQAFGVVADKVDASDSTTSTGYADLTTVGPTVTTTIGNTGRCLVFLSATLNPTVNDGSAMSVDISGATTVSPSDIRIRPYQVMWGTNDQVVVSAGRPSLITGLNPGTHTFVAKYRSVFGASVSIGNRNIIVMPL